MQGLTLIIGNKNYSSWSLRPWLFLKHFNIPFTEKRVTLFTPYTKSQLARYNSDFKVPVLLDGEHTVWDSLSILEYLSEQYVELAGWPQDSHARAHARSISSEMHSSFSHVRNEMPMNCRRQFSNINFSDEAKREVERIRQLWRGCREQYQSEGKWLFGQFSIADAMFAPVVLRFSGYNIPLDGLELEYMEHVLAHPAIMEWIEAGKRETEVIAEDEIDI